MQLRLFCSILCAGLTLGTAQALSHEFWIEPEKYQVDSEERVVARLRNGQEFRGAEQPYLDHRIARFDVLRQGISTAYTGRMGDMPAFAQDLPQDGLAVLVHQTQPQTLTYDSWEEFQAFIDHKGFGDVRRRHQARGLPQAGFSEQYTRYAKTIIAIGNGKGMDHAAGLETEILALANPYTNDLTQGMPIRVLYQNSVRPQAQIEVFDKSPENLIKISTLLSDDNGEVVIPVSPGHSYLVDAVVLRPAPEGSDYVWESHWASLTFAIPPGPVK